ncbi:uncharacterized protein LOC100678315 [Nasonia vitripennis]|uniref:Uncharacterized protein n=1 Tax=Nasonia vitripennis TaxID=7425 RepID=A0A7M7GCR8_NASVI|nr:uncharacterized protein LOC100678315 [Nasonia vitripennis]
MEIKHLNRAVDELKEAIANFPVGATTLDDFKPTDEKIIDIRKSLTALNARRLTLHAIIDSGISSNEPQGDLIKSFEKLNESSTNYLINSKTLKLCYQSRAIQDIVYKGAGTPEIQEKVKACLNKLFMVNDKMTAKNEKRKELVKKQYQLKKEFHHAIYHHQEVLQEKEARKNQHLQETNPDIVQLKEKINRSIAKIYTMKKLITNLIAAMSEHLQDNEELIDMLSKHKEVINLETIIELTQKQSSGNS